MDRFGDGPFSSLLFLYLSPLYPLWKKIIPGGVGEGRHCTLHNFFFSLFVGFVFTTGFYSFFYFSSLTFTLLLCLFFFCCTAAWVFFILFSGCVFCSPRIGELDLGWMGLDGVGGKFAWPRTFSAFFSLFSSLLLFFFILLSTFSYLTFQILHFASCTPLLCSASVCSGVLSIWWRSIPSRNVFAFSFLSVSV